MTDRVQCPDCKGKGACFAHVNTGPDSSGHYWGDVKCLRCDGSGEVPAAMLEQMRKGRLLRDARVARDESLYECAKRVNISSAKLSAIEHGRDTELYLHPYWPKAVERPHRSDGGGAAVEKP